MECKLISGVPLINISPERRYPLRHKAESTEELPDLELDQNLDQNPELLLDQNLEQNLGLLLDQNLEQNLGLLLDQNLGVLLDQNQPVPEWRQRQTQTCTLPRRGGFLWRPGGRAAPDQ
ncbi:unnamed protein product [Boreogadus saida]